MRLHRIVSLLACISLAPTSFASQIVDQENLIFNSFLGPDSSAGQSFTPTASTLDFATFQLNTSNASTSVSVTVFAGDGFGGTALGTSSSATVLNGVPQNVLFTFSTLVLTPGDVYTFRLNDSAGNLIEYAGYGNFYNGGVEYTGSGAAQPLSDLAFSEGYNSPAVTPEPSSLALLGTGMAGVAAMWRKRRGLDSA